MGQNPLRTGMPRRADSQVGGHILAFLQDAAQPLSAYELLHRLEATQDRKIVPPTIYRALDAPLGQGHVARIESRSAYVVCAHTGHAHDCVFFVCDRCRGSKEIEDRTQQALLSQRAQSLGFKVTHRVLEMVGICDRCQSTEELRAS